MERSRSNTSCNPLPPLPAAQLCKLNAHAAHLIGQPDRLGSHCFILQYVHTISKAGATANSACNDTYGILPHP